jgi:hypothetical protein
VCRFTCLANETFDSARFWDSPFRVFLQWLLLHLGLGLILKKRREKGRGERSNQVKFWAFSTDKSGKGPGTSIFRQGMREQRRCSQICLPHSNFFTIPLLLVYSPAGVSLSSGDKGDIWGFLWAAFNLEL